MKNLLHEKCIIIHFQIFKLHNILDYHYGIVVYNIVVGVVVVQNIYYFSHYQ